MTLVRWEKYFIAERNKMGFIPILLSEYVGNFGGTRYVVDVYWFSLYVLTNCIVP